MTHALLTALGLVLVIEGLVYALVPGHLKGVMKAMSSVPDDALRLGGVAAIGAGVLVVWVIQQIFAGA
jgi:uncharacterized protein YjeT (DUF2065 family)